MPSDPGKASRPEAVLRASAPKRRIMLTVDVEAFELRAKTRPLEKLIWGRFPEGDYGLERIMSLAEALGIKLSMFLDYPEYYAYGDALLDVGREIRRRGHDLNLHLHLDCIPRGYFAQRGLPEGLDLNTFTDEVATASISDLLELHSRVSSDAPVALRGGGYRYNAALLRAMRGLGVPMSCNYNPAAKLQPFSLGPKRQFRWETGTLELPVATLYGFLDRAYPIHFNFNIGLFTQQDPAASLANTQTFLDQFYEQYGEDAVAVFVLHSWSFLRMDGGGEFSIVDPTAPERLRAFLEHWGKTAEFVTAREVAELAEAGALAVDGPVAIPSLMLTRESDKMPAQPPAPTPNPATACCPICGTPTSAFVDYNGPKRQCSGCGSTERQRAFADLYPRFIKPEFDLVGKDVLVAAPGGPEKRFLKAQGISWSSVDIRPEVKADITADLCDLSSIPDCQFDAVIASFVLTCVHDIAACLAELQRILRPGGRLFTCDPLRFGLATAEYSDMERVTAWYGREAYDKYRIGTFRTFGDLDLLEVLREHGFVTKTLYWHDVATDSRWVWHVSAKAPASRVSVAPRLGGGGEDSAQQRALQRRVAELELDLERHRQATASLADEVERAKDTLSFRLGYLLLHAPKSWAGLRGLPAELLELHRESKRRRSGRGRSAAARRHRAGPNVGALVRRPQDFAEDVFRRFIAEGLEPALALAEAGAQNERERAFAFSRLGKALAASDPKAALGLARRAYELEPVPFRAKWLAFLSYTCGELSAPAKLLELLPPDFTLELAEAERKVEILGLARAQASLPRIPAAALRIAYEPVPDSCLYVTGSALPFHVAGYTVRSHALIGAIAGTGHEVTAALRPGYPADRGIDFAEDRHELDGVVYRHLSGPHVRRLPLDEFTDSAAQALVELAKSTRPQIVHAASNHVNALPALLAARRLGVPFVYEVRGLWELTAATKAAGWEQTERFALQRELEALVAREADHVLTLTEGLAGELTARGVPRERISIVPNCVDPERFAPRVKDAALSFRFGLAPSTFTLVYAGSLLAYEGLDDVLRAVAVLVGDGIDVKLLIAGDGEARTGLQQLSHQLSLENVVRFLGRLAPEEIPALWSLADAAPFARKPFRVCELVSPLKPLEAMAMAIPVVVSDVAALSEMVRDGETGLVHKAGDHRELAAKLGELASAPMRRRALGNAAREAVLRERTWQVAAANVVEVYRRLVHAQRPSRIDLKASGL